MHVCVCAGTLNVTLGSHGEPWVLVDPSDLRSNEFFSRPKQVQSEQICHTPHSACIADRVYLLAFTPVARWCW